VLLTDSQKAILEYLKPRDWVSPTEIGMEVGHQGRSFASAWTWSKGSSLFVLIEKGLVEKNGMGMLRLKKT